VKRLQIITEGIPENSETLSFPTCFHEDLGHQIIGFYFLIFLLYLSVGL
jgi:hypothetical protein